MSEKKYSKQHEWVTLQGDVATNFQFYLTDSVSQFARGEIILNCKPNYDSLIARYLSLLIIS